MSQIATEAAGNTTLALGALANATRASQPRETTHVFVVLPAYNEEGNIGRLLQQLEAAAARVTFPLL